MSSDSSDDRNGTSLTSLAQYQEHVPGRMVLSSGEELGGDLWLRSHVFSAEQEATSTPSIPQHTLTFAYVGPIQGARRVAGGPWCSFDTKAEGHVTIRPAGCSTALRWTAECPVRSTSLYVAPARLEDVGLQMGMAPARIELPDRFNVADPELQALAQTLRRVVATEVGDDPLYLQTALQSIVVRLLRRHGTTSPPESDAAGGLSRARLRRVERYVHAHLDADLSLDDLAEEVGLSKYHFSRRFKQRTGQSPYQFVIYERVRRARSLLRDTTRPLAQIAFDVGFSSQSHFTRTFKRYVGATPGRYRAAWR